MDVSFLFFFVSISNGLRPKSDRRLQPTSDGPVNCFVDVTLMILARCLFIAKARWIPKAVAVFGVCPLQCLMWRPRCDEGAVCGVKVLSSAAWKAHLQSFSPLKSTLSVEATVRRLATTAPAHRTRAACRTRSSEEPSKHKNMTSELGSAYLEAMASNLTSDGLQVFLDQSNRLALSVFYTSRLVQVLRRNVESDLSAATALTLRNACAM